MTLTTVNPALLDTQAQYTGFKNRIINGAMVIDQRNAGASVTPTDTGGGTYVIDRFYARVTQASKLSYQRSTVAPEGFTNSLALTSLSAYSVTSSDHFAAIQAIEGFNVADLGWGTANAKPITFSFKVRSSLTGTFGGFVSNSDANRCYVFSYTINAANTFEDKTVTIFGDTSGTWFTNNGVGLYLSFSVGAGSSVTSTAGSWGSTFYRSVTGQASVVGTSGATFYITGVQLEKGSTATSFDYRPYGTELQLCQRYYQTTGGAGSAYPRILQGAYTAGTYVGQSFPYIVSMRATPTGAIAGAWTNQNTTSGSNTINTSKDGFLLYTTAPSATVIAGLYPTDATGLITLTAEL